MANDNANQVPQGAIPPKAVPPPTGETPTATSRTVRLKPLTPGAAPATASRLPPVVPSAPAGTEAASSAIKRMTTRISTMANEIDPLTGRKLTGPIPAESVSEAPVAQKSATRVPLSSTARIPELADMPRTARGRVEPPAVMGQPPSQQPAGKAKTSRISLESAMGVPSTDAGIPKTIKLKRPDEALFRVATPGAEEDADGSAPAQKKTIRVKRPTVPEASAQDEAADSAPVSPLTFVPAPERGTGLFVLLAVAALLVAIGLTGLFTAQLFGWPVPTALDTQFQKG